MAEKGPPPQALSSPAAAEQPKKGMLGRASGKAGSLFGRVGRMWGGTAAARE